MHEANEWGIEVVPEQPGSGAAGAGTAALPQGLEYSMPVNLPLCWVSGRDREGRFMGGPACRQAENWWLCMAISCKGSGSAQMHMRGDGKPWH